MKKYNHNNSDFLIMNHRLVGKRTNKIWNKFMVQVDGLGCPFLCPMDYEKKFKEFKGIKKCKN